MALRSAVGESANPDVALEVLRNVVGLRVPLRNRVLGDPAGSPSTRFLSGTRSPTTFLKTSRATSGFADSPTADRSAMIGKFNPKDQTFTFYPKPQFSADTHKIQLTKEGAIWFAPRGSRDAPAISVMY